jgi:hypothetical protein
MTIVHAEPVEVQDRLAQLGLTVEELHRILEQAHADRRDCTKLDPITLPGNVFWGRVIRYAREIYLLKGWKLARPKLVELVVNPSEEFGFTACSGDRATGRPELTPSSRYGKGTAMAERIAANQLVLPGMEAVRSPDDDQYEGLKTWCLLYYHEPVKDEESEKTILWAEIALPERISDRGKIDSWIERILLPPLEFDEAFVLPDPDIEPGPDIDVPIERLS